MDELEPRPKRTHEVAKLRRSTIGGRPHYADERETPRLRRDRLRSAPRPVKVDNEADVRRFRRIERAERIGGVAVAVALIGFLVGVILAVGYALYRALSSGGTGSGGF